MIYIKNDGANVVAVVEVLGWKLHLTNTRGHELDAIALASKMKSDMENRLEQIRKDAYNLGYANGRAKVKKQSVFSCWW